MSTPTQFKNLKEMVSSMDFKASFHAHAIFFYKSTDIAITRHFKSEL